MLRRCLLLALLLFNLLPPLMPVISAHAATCVGGAPHRFNAYGECTVCHTRAAAVCGDRYYESVADALGNAKVGDTVSVFYDNASPNTRYEIAEGITLVCRGAELYATVCNYGRIEGGLFMAAVENHGTVTNSEIYGSLLCYPKSKATDILPRGTLYLYGGSIACAASSALTVALCPTDAAHDITLDLSATPSFAAITLTNESVYPLSMDFLRLPEGYAFFPSNGETVYTETAVPGCTLVLTEHTHTPAPQYRYDAATHYTVCSVCGYRDPDTQRGHRFTYTDNGNGTHRAFCNDCGYTDILPHTGGIATCLAAASCVQCHTTYGTPDRDAHLTARDGICMLCGYRYAAFCGSTFYKSASSALAEAAYGDTVILLCDSSEAEILIREGITLTCREHTLTATVINHGALSGGVFTGRVENRGTVNGSSFLGTLVNEGSILSATLSCEVENRIGGYIANITEGDIRIGDGFSLVSDGVIDCKHHFGGRPSCTAYALCRLCGTAYGELSAHSFGDYRADDNATCTFDGTRTAVCESCNAKDTVGIPNSRLPHSDHNGDNLCDGCALFMEVPPKTTAPPLTQTPVTTAAPLTSSTALTTNAPTTGSAAVTEPTLPPTQPTVISHLAWWHYAIIGLALGVLTLFSIGKRR